MLTGLPVDTTNSLSRTSATRASCPLLTLQKKYSVGGAVSPLRSQRPPPSPRLSPSPPRLQQTSRRAAKSVLRSEIAPHAELARWLGTGSQHLLYDRLLLHDLHPLHDLPLLHDLHRLHDLPLLYDRRSRSLTEPIDLSRNNKINLGGSFTLRGFCNAHTHSFTLTHRRQPAGQEQSG